MSIIRQHVHRAVPYLDPHCGFAARRAASAQMHAAFSGQQDTWTHRGTRPMGTWTPVPPPTPEVHVRGHAFRRGLAVATAAPVLAVTQVAMDVVRPAVTGLSQLLFAVAGPTAGVIGAGLGVGVGLISGRASLLAGLDGYRQGQAVARDGLMLASWALVGLVAKASQGLVILAALCGHAVGVALCAPLFVLGKRTTT